MEEAVAIIRNLRGSPTKIRPIMDQIRGLGADKALNILEFSNKRVARAIKEGLKSAIANAENNQGMDVDTLVVSRAYVDKGMVMKRFRPRARGRASRILKRSSHVTLAVSSRD